MAAGEGGGQARQRPQENLGTLKNGPASRRAHADWRQRSGCMLTAGSGHDCHLVPLACGHEGRLERGRNAVRGHWRHHLVPWAQRDAVRFRQLGLIQCWGNHSVLCDSGHPHWGWHAVPSLHDVLRVQDIDEDLIVGSCWTTSRGHGGWVTGSTVVRARGPSSRSWAWCCGCCGNFRAPRDVQRAGLVALPESAIELLNGELRVPRRRGTGGAQHPAVALLASA